MAHVSYNLCLLSTFGSTYSHLMSLYRNPKLSAHFVKKCCSDRKWHFMMSEMLLRNMSTSITLYLKKKKNTKQSGIVLIFHFEVIFHFRFFFFFLPIDIIMTFSFKKWKRKETFQSLKPKYMSGPQSYCISLVFYVKFWGKTVPFRMKK